MPWWKRLITTIIKIIKALVNKKQENKTTKPTALDELLAKEEDKKMDIAIALKIIELVVEVGVPAAKELFETWSNDTPITAEEIEKAKMKTKEASTYFE